MKEMSIHTRLYREKLLKDPYRPGYHFAIADGNGSPGDSNGAFFADGRYHLMYLYRNDSTQAYHWGHVSSIDLITWRHHPDALMTENGDEGCFSGGAFVDEDGTAYLSFWKFPARDPQGDNGGIDIAFSRPPYDVWERIRPIAIEGIREPWGTMDVEVNGEVLHIGCADPSNIWKANGIYYMQLGNLCVLNAYGRKPDSPEMYRGDWTELFKSTDLKTWTFVKRFYTNPRAGEDWPDETEDDMCPSFLPLPDKKSGGQLTDKYLQLFIAHNKGCQYYIGELKNETFYPEQHGRMSWKDKAYFAPEALIDGKNRQLAWVWLLDNLPEDVRQYGWTGVYGLPRALWYEDGGLRMAPAEEIDRLQYNGQTFDAGEVSGHAPLPVKNGESFRIRAQIDMKGASRAGFAVRIDPEKDEYTLVYYDKAAGKLVMDAEKSGFAGWKIKEEAPFALKDGEALSIDLFVDKSVVEVYANERQAICRRVYPSVPARAAGVYAFSDGADFGVVHAWEMFPGNPY